MYNFDSVLDATNYTPSRNREAGPVIVSERHNLNDISTDGMKPTSGGKPSDGLRRQIASVRSGAWDAAEYGISADAQVAKLEVALAKAEAYEATPEGMERARLEAEKAMVEMRERAIRRAGLDTSNGRVNIMVAGKAAWHGLGVNVASAVTSEHAMRLAGLDWTVDKVPVGYTWNGQTTTLDDQFALVRTDTGARLSMAGSGYKPVQNVQAFEFMDAIMGEFGARYEVAMSLRGGEVIALVVALPGQSFTLAGGDENLAYATLMNPHTIGKTLRCFPTSVRSECANTLNVAMNEGGEGIRIRHTGNIKSKIKEAQKALGIAVREFDQYREGAEELSRKPLPEAKSYFADVLDQMLDVTASDVLVGAEVLAKKVAVEKDWLTLMGEVDAQNAVDAEFKRISKAIERRAEIADDIMGRYESATNGVSGMRGMAWSAMNAVTEHANYNRVGRQRGSESDRSSRRLESVLSGDANAMSQVAYKLALAY